MLFSTEPVSTGLAAEDWPEFRGPHSDGTSTAMGLPRTWSETENVRWKTAIHGRGWSSPVILGQQVWLTTASPDGKTRSALCIDRDSGKVLRDLKLFDVEEPQEIHLTNSYASPTPVLEPGRVYVTFGAAGTAALDAQNGEKLWERRDLECNHWRGAGSSPILWKNLWICHFDGADHQFIIALDKQTGKTVWRRERSHGFGGTDNGDLKKAYSTPLLIEAAGKTQLISAASRAVFSYEPASGEEIWHVTFERFSSTARPLFDGELVYANTGFGKGELLAIRPDGSGDVSKNRIVWHVKRGVGSKTSSILHDGLIYSVVDKGGVVSCIEAKTGEPVWTDRVGGNFSASPVLADGLIWFCDERGKTTAIAPGRKFEKVGVNRLESGCMASPAVAGKALYIRTRTHLYRIEKDEGRQPKQAKAG